MSVVPTVWGHQIWVLKTVLQQRPSGFDFMLLDVYLSPTSGYGSLLQHYCVVYIISKTLWAKAEGVTLVQPHTFTHIPLASLILLGNQESQFR